MGNTGPEPEAVEIVPTTDSLLSQIGFEQCNAFGITIVSNNSAADAELLHVCSIAREFLDNDEDGVVDDELVSKELEISVILMFANEADKTSALNLTIENALYANFLNVGFIYENEVEVGGLFLDDGAYSKVWSHIHLAGYAQVYDALEIVGTSDLLDAVADARKTSDNTPPEPYDVDAWFKNPDKDCDARCNA